MPIETRCRGWRRTFVAKAVLVGLVAVVVGCGARLERETEPANTIAAVPGVDDAGVDVADGAEVGGPETAPGPTDGDVISTPDPEDPHPWATGKLCDGAIGSGARPMTSLASLGVDHRTLSDAAWTGREMVVAATSPYPCSTPTCSAKQAIFAYDPATDRWRPATIIELYGRSVGGPLLSLGGNDVARVDLQQVPPTYWISRNLAGASASSFDAKGTCTNGAGAVGWAPTTQELVVWGGGVWDDGPTWVPCAQGVAIHDGVSRVIAPPPPTLHGGHVTFARVDSALLVLDWDDDRIARYDAELDRWTDLGAMPKLAGRDAPGAMGQLDGKLAFYGGEEFGGNESSFVATDGASFDLSTSTWRTLPSSPPTALGDRWRDFPASWMQPGPSGGGELVMFSGFGYEHDDLLPDMIAVDVQTGSWRTISTKPGLGPRTHARAVWDGCEAIVYGGDVEGAPLSDGALFKP